MTQTPSGSRCGVGDVTIKLGLALTWPKLSTRCDKPHVFMRNTLIVHERLARWTRRLRVRVDRWGVRLVESRSVDDLTAAALTACPVVLIDPSGNPSAALDALLAVRRVASQALVLVIEESLPTDFPVAAREAGATLILPSTSPMPVIFDLIRRWLDLAGQRSAAEGWAADRRGVPEPWESISLNDDPDQLAPMNSRIPTAL